MKVLVTGGSGMVGRYVVDELALTHAVEVLDLKPLHRNDLPFHRVDVLDLPAVSSLVKGFDAIVHLAGIPHPLTEPAEKVFRVNTLGTYNTLEACLLNGIKKFIFMSSESTLGFAFSTTRIWPEYIPIDESHPLRPQDPYGLSKVAGEMLCKGFSEKVELQTICLRAPWIWVPEERAHYKKLVTEYDQWRGNLWAFVHVKDVARAIAQVLENNSLKRHDAFFICADKNWAGRDSRSLLAEFYPEITNIAKDFGHDQSLISNRKAKQSFGFTPRFGAKDILEG
jgi:UDP-glucose 4-epimerase